MRIARVDVYGCELPYTGGAFELSLGRVVSAPDSTLVLVTTDDGVEGWGEACPLSGTYLPAFAGGVRAALREIAPALVGADPCNLADVNARMDATLLGQEAAKSALDMACWDILGRVAGLPLATLLGGRVTERFRLYLPISRGSPDETEALVRDGWARGIRRFQLKVGGDPLADAESVRRAVELAGDEGVVVADANGGWGLHDALIAARALEPLPVYLEQPCRTLADCVHVHRATTLPLIYDEVVTDAATFVAAVRDGGAVAVNLKLGKVGGLTRARGLRDLAQSLGTLLTIEDTWGDDVATAAVSHLAASTRPDALFSVSFPNDATSAHLAGHRPRSANGYGSAPDGPGLGISVDAERLGEPLFSSTETR